MEKEKPIIFGSESVKAILNGSKYQTRRVVKEPAQTWMNEATNPDWWEGINNLSPYQIGSHLWVREAWANRNELVGSKYYYKTDDNGCLDLTGSWKPSIHMPKKASRITLEIINIRVERLNDISDEDIKAEGFSTSHYYCDERVGHVCTSARDLFINRWDFINGKRNGCSWKDSPWVWCISFRRVE